MRPVHKILIALPISLLLAAAGVSGANAAPALASVDAIRCPAVTLGDWNESSRQDKLSFLLGFVTRLEMEKEWQGPSPLPVRQSTASLWVKGLGGHTLGQLVETVDKYAKEHPDQMHLQVVEVLGRVYVTPKMTEAQMKEARKRFSEIGAAGK